MKSGTDFRNFSVVTLDFNSSKESSENKDEKSSSDDIKPGLRVEISSVDVTKDFEPDPELGSLLEKYKGTAYKTPNFILSCKMGVIAI